MGKCVLPAFLREFVKSSVRYVFFPSGGLTKQKNAIMINAVSIQTDRRIRNKGYEEEEYMAGPKREDGSPAERLSGKVVMEGSF